MCHGFDRPQLAGRLKLDMAGVRKSDVLMMWVMWSIDSMGRSMAKRDPSRLIF
jgi:hypothetical protein